ncbi:MAG: glycosyltransferase family 4 protein [Acidobacteriota bacterium]
MKLIVCHTDYRLYWPARFRALREFLAEKGIQMRVVEIAGKGSPYAFAENQSCKCGDWDVLFPQLPMEAIGSRKASAAVFKALEDWNPDIVMAGPIAFPSGATAVRWASHRKKPVIIADDVRVADVPRNALVNWVKRRIYANVDAVLLPAPARIRDYEFWGVPRGRMFFGLNAVDNDFFAIRSEKARADAERLRSEWNLPDKFVLGVGRQVAKKNWLTLLEAWDLYRQRCTDSSMHLVLVGNGPDRNRLENSVRSLALQDVHLRDFASQEDIAALYGLAHGLVLPSHHGETWGLVVNEAMASGLPVLVSRECGCAASLVEEGGNGWCFAPDAAEEMATCLLKLCDLSQQQRGQMGRRSREIIADWGLRRFCQGVWEAIGCAQRQPIRKSTLLDRLLLHFWNGRYRPV